MSTLQERLVEVADSIGNDAELARIAGVTRSNVSQWRKGDIKSLKALPVINIQEKTGYSAKWLVLGTGHKRLTGKQEHVKEDARNKLSPKDEQKLLVVLRVFFDTDDEGKNQIVEAVEAIAGENGAGRQPDKQHKRSHRR